MRATVIFETHATSEDNENGVATGWLGGRLSAAGREQARALGARRTGSERIYASDLNRAVETAAIAFPGRSVILDWRLRECDYGDWNGMPRTRLDDERVRRVDEPFPSGESWRQAVARVESFLAELRDGQSVVIGHIATRWACEHRFRGRTVEELAAEEFVWQPGWEYALPRMTVKLHRCGKTWLKLRAEPCWRVQKALDDMGIAYDVVTGPQFPRSKRTDVIAGTGQSAFPAIQFSDGTWYREESREMERTVREGRLLEKAVAI